MDSSVWLKLKKDWAVSNNMIAAMIIRHTEFDFVFCKKGSPCDLYQDKYEFFAAGIIVAVKRITDDWDEYHIFRLLKYSFCSGVMR